MVSSTTKWLNLAVTPVLLVLFCGCATARPTTNPDPLARTEREIERIKAEQRSAAEQQAKKDEARFNLCSEQEAKCMGPLWELPFDKMNGDQMVVNIECDAAFNNCMGIKPAPDDTCDEFEICDPDDRICALQKQVCDLKQQVEDIQDSPP
jgi:hypothetical protein